MSEKKIIDLNEIKDFFEPNSGKCRCGAEAPLPGAIKRVADELNGKSVSLLHAMEKIISATNGRGEVVLLGDCIALYSIKRTSPLFEKYPVHLWRVIRYK